MIRNINLNKQFASTSNVATPFKPYEEPPRTAKIYLNSQDKMWGTNNDATFKVNLPTEFTTQKLNLTLNNFIPVYPTNTLSDIVAVDMIGVENPYSYSSSTDKTHRTLGIFPLNEGVPREYPPVAMTADTTNIIGQAYGDGTYTTSFSSADTTSFAFQAFNKAFNGNIPRTSFSTSNAYNGTTGFYEGTASNSTVMSGSNYFGEYLTIQLPSSILLQSYSYTSHGEFGNRSGNQWVLGGSIDGNNWILLDTESNVFWDNSNQTKDFPIANNTQSFNYYRMLTTRVGNSNVSSFRNDWGIAELKLYGYSNPQTISSSRVGQCSLNCEIITTDKSLFNRPITLQLKSLTGGDLSGFSDWSAELTVSETK